MSPGYAEQSRAFENELNLLMRLQVKDGDTYALKCFDLILCLIILQSQLSSPRVAMEMQEKRGRFWTTTSQGKIWPSNTKSNKNAHSTIFFFNHGTNVRSHKSPQ